MPDIEADTYRVNFWRRITVVTVRANSWLLIAYCLWSLIWGRHLSFDQRCQNAALVEAVLASILLASRFAVVQLQRAINRHALVFLVRVQEIFAT